MQFAIEGTLIYGSLEQAHDYQQGQAKYYAALACDASYLGLLMREAQRAMMQFFGTKQYPVNLIKVAGNLRRPVPWIPEDSLVIHTSTRERPWIMGDTPIIAGDTVIANLYIYAHRKIESIGFGLYSLQHLPR